MSVAPCPRTTRTPSSGGSPAGPTDTMRPASTSTSRPGSVSPLLDVEDGHIVEQQPAGGLGRRELVPQADRLRTPAVRRDPDQLRAGKSGEALAARGPGGKVHRSVEDPARSGGRRARGVERISASPPSRARASRRPSGEKTGPSESRVRSWRPVLRAAALPRCPPKRAPPGSPLAESARRTGSGSPARSCRPSADQLGIPAPRRAR